MVRRRSHPRTPPTRPRTLSAGAFRIFSKTIGVGFNDELNKQLVASLQNIPPEWGSLLFHKLRSSAIIESDPEPWLHADLASAGFNRRQIEHLQVRALSNIADKNPERAQELLGDSKLSEDAHREIIGEIFRNSTNDPEKTRQWFAMLDSKSDRQIAREAIENAAANRKEIKKRPDEKSDE